jgi:hypothetical protein
MGKQANFRMLLTNSVDGSNQEFGKIPLQIAVISMKLAMID